MIRSVFCSLHTSNGGSCSPNSFIHRVAEVLSPSLHLRSQSLASPAAGFSSRMVLQDNMGSRVSWSLTIYAILLLYSMKLVLVPSESASRPTLGNMTDRLALLAFKDGISDDPLRALSSWNDSLHFCKWEGVICGRRHRRVSVLNLESKSLAGTLASSVGNLTFLKVIRLGNSNFYGEVPSEIGRLFRLRYLNLSYNQFTGEVPSEIGRLFQLVYLILRKNQFTGEIPVNLTNSPALQFIDFDSNKLTGKIPAKLGSMPYLAILYLSRNNLTGGIPPSFGNLSYLSGLSLRGNSLEGNIPDDLGRCSNLAFLQLAENKLSGTLSPALYNLSLMYMFSVADNRLTGTLPPNIGLTLPNLQALYVSLNQLTGPIPVTLSNSSALQYLDLPDNNFSGQVPVNLGSLKFLQELNLAGNSLETVDSNDLNFLITSLANCTSLQSLDLSYNHFRGVLPDSVANLSTQLIWLALVENEISGSIPAGIENLVKLNFLAMSTNFLTGSIPVGIGKLRRLGKLLLDHNELSGLIPSSLGNITQLYELHLEENSLKGSIPSSLGDCHRLQILNLSRNNLDGTIPKQVIGLSSLSISLNLAHNSFSGSLPLEIGNLKQLGELDISDNQFSGKIPDILGECLSLVYLHMQANFFQGSIPLSLRNLKGIQELDLSRNNLSGRIPKYLENFTSLINLNLSFNDLEGEVPVEGVFKNASAISVFGNKKLCGGILALQLAPCPIQASKKHGKSLAFKLTVTIIGVFLFLSLILIFVMMRWKRKSRKIPSSYSMKDSYMKVSYQDLLKATDGFSLANLIGVGSFGSVYKGVLEPDKRPVAVKVLNLQEQGASKSFTAECNALRNIRHRNLIKILTSCSSLDFKGNNFKALVFEFMPNGSLEKWLHPKVDEQGQSRTLNFLERLNIAIDVASALDYLHHHCETPIIHCDLKPSNVLLDDDMTAHVGDFGLARFLLDNNNIFSQNQSSSIGIRGSIGYIAPEYGMGCGTSIHGDVYSYGILLLEMFTGKIPTDNIFSGGLSLHEFSKKALPGRLMEIVDPIILLEIGATNKVGCQNDRRDKLEECLASMVGIAISCSAELPRDRMMMRDVVRELHLIRNSFFGSGIRN